MTDAASSALAHIPVAVLVERCKAKSPWVDFIWRPVAVLAGTPQAAPWTALGGADDVALFYAGDAVVELYRTETANYRSNLSSGAPALWVVLRRDGSQSAYKLFTVTADPAEGEAFTDAGSDVVEAVPMPAVIAEAIDDFIAKHHVERPFFKRRRDEQATSRVADRRGAATRTEYERT